MVCCVLCGKFVPNQMHNSSKSYVPDLVFSVSTKSTHHLDCNSVMLFELVLVNIRFPPVHVRVNEVKFICCNLRIFSLVKSMFIYLNTVCSLNVCNAVKSMGSAHHIHIRTSYFQSLMMIQVTIDRLYIQKQMPFLLLELNLLPHIRLQILDFSACNLISEPSTYFFISEILCIFNDAF